MYVFCCPLKYSKPHRLTVWTQIYAKPHQYIYINILLEGLNRFNGACLFCMKDPLLISASSQWKEICKSYLNIQIIDNLGDPDK